MRVRTGSLRAAPSRSGGSRRCRITKALLRPMSTAAIEIKGEFVDPTYHGKYEWCFVRARKYVLRCGYLIP